jgi:hypothetical protein
VYQCFHCCDARTSDVPTPTVTIAHPNLSGHLIFDEQYSPMGFKGKLSKKKKSNWDYTFFLVILTEIFILKTTMYYKYTLKYQKLTKKKCRKRLLSSMFHFALNIGGISAQSHMLLFVTYFSSYLNLVITL